MTTDRRNTASTRASYPESVPLGFATATAVWIVAFVGRLPSNSFGEGWLLALLLGVMVVGAIFAGWHGGSARNAVKTLMVAGLVNVLLVGSVVSAASGPQVTADPNPIKVSALVWIPGSLAASAVIGLVGGWIGARFASSVVAEETRLDLAWRDIRACGWQAMVILVTTFVLISVGAIVTSAEVGLAVPDWPRSYGYNMFLFPFTKMVGGIFYEHAHRLIGSLVGLQTLTLAIWIWAPRRRGVSAVLRVGQGQCATCAHDLRGADHDRCPECGEPAESRGPKTPANDDLVRRLLFIRRLAIVALILVIIQGMFGGFRVVLVNSLGHDPALAFAVAHATTAQLFVLAVLLLWWKLDESTTSSTPIVARRPVRSVDAIIAILLTGFIVLQTIAGAILRHFGYDWALLAHLLGAVVVTLLALTVVTAIMSAGAEGRLRRVGLALMVASVLQILLGAVAWWATTRIDRFDQVASPWILALTATHVVNGALVLSLSWVSALELSRMAPIHRRRGRIQRAESLQSPLRAHEGVAG
ncbi:MAG: heme A synthase [Phycisphaerales bacterium]